MEEGDDEDEDEGGEAAKSGGDNEKWHELDQEHSFFKEFAKGVRKKDDKAMTSNQPFTTKN